MVDQYNLRKILTRLNAKPRSVRDFTSASAQGDHQWKTELVEEWLGDMKKAGLVMKLRHHWCITSLGQSHLARMEGAAMPTRICASSSRTPLVGYGAYMARSEGRPGANDYRRFARVGF
jgi:hypothetical protein